MRRERLIVDEQSVTQEDEMSLEAPSVTETESVEAPTVESVSPEVEDAGDEPFDRGQAQVVIDRIKKDRREARANLTKAEKALSEAEAKIAALERERMTEEEKKAADYEAAQARIVELEREAQATKDRLQAQMTQNVLIGALSKPDLNIVDVNAALKLLDVSELEFEDDGRPTADTIDASIQRALESYPFLIRSPNERNLDAGSAANPSRATSTDLPEETHEQKRERIYGRPSNIFDSKLGSTLGGGVVYMGADQASSNEKP